MGRKKFKNSVFTVPVVWRTAWNRILIWIPMRIWITAIYRYWAPVPKGTIRYHSSKFYENLGRGQGKNIFAQRKKRPWYSATGKDAEKSRETVPWRRCRGSSRPGGWWGAGWRRGSAPSSGLTHISTQLVTGSSVANWPIIRPHN